MDQKDKGKDRRVLDLSSMMFPDLSDLRPEVQEEVRRRVTPASINLKFARRGCLVNEYLAHVVEGMFDYVNARNLLGPDARKTAPRVGGYLLTCVGMRLSPFGDLWRDPEALGITPTEAQREAARTFAEALDAGEVRWGFQLNGLWSCGTCAGCREEVNE